MAVYLKQGFMGSYSRPMAWALGKIHARCQRVYLSLLITSIGEGNHSAGSLHYLEPSNAVDITPAVIIRHSTWANWACMKGGEPVYPTLEELKEDLSQGRFGGQFDVVDEGNHFHVEYDPKEG